MWVGYSDIWRYNHQASFLGAAQQDISLFSSLLILVVQNRLAQVAG
jgi:hypothetical protein